MKTPLAEGVVQQLYPQLATRCLFFHRNCTYYTDQNQNHLIINKEIMYLDYKLVLTSKSYSCETKLCKCSTLHREAHTVKWRNYKHMFCETGCSDLVGNLILWKIRSVNWSCWLRNYLIALLNLSINTTWSAYSFKAYLTGMRLLTQASGCILPGYLEDAHLRGEKNCT